MDRMRADKTWHYLTTFICLSAFILAITGCCLPYWSTTVEEDVGIWYTNCYRSWNRNHCHLANQNCYGLLQAVRGCLIAGIIYLFFALAMGIMFSVVPSSLGPSGGIVYFMSMAFIMLLAAWVEWFVLTTDTTCGTNNLSTSWILVIVACWVTFLGCITACMDCGQISRGLPTYTY